MTTREEQELKRLEVNVRRLIEQMKIQTQELVQLREQAREQASRILELEAALAKAEAQAQVTRVAQVLGGEQRDTSEAQTYLSGIISEIEYCIRQLEQD